MAGSASGHVAPMAVVGRERGQVVEMQRRRVLLAAAEVLAEDGVDGAGAGRISQRAGVSRRTFYDLFADREACFLAAFDQAIEQIGKQVVPAYMRDGRWRERMRAGLTMLLECFDDEPTLARLCVVEALKGGPDVLERRRSVTDLLITAVDAGHEESKKGVQVSPLAAESTVGGVLAVIHSRLLERDGRPLLELVSPLMGMIVQPYLGSAACKRELAALAPRARGLTLKPGDHKPFSDPFKDLSIRITYRTMRVLSAIAARPGASNRQVGESAGILDQGQISRLLARLERGELVETDGLVKKGEANVWRLSPRGRAVHEALDVAGGST